MMGAARLCLRERRDRYTCVTQTNSFLKPIMAHLLDIFDLALKKKSAEGEIPVRDLPNLRAFLATDEGAVRWRAQGEGERRGHPAARLSMEGEAFMSCARCNKPVAVTFSSEAVFLFVKDEAEANSMPIAEDEDDEDVVVGSRHFSMDDWAEEEAILSLPTLPVHDDCGEERWEDEPEAPVEKPNPFAALAALKKH